MGRVILLLFCFQIFNGFVAFGGDYAGRYGIPIMGIADARLAEGRFMDSVVARVTAGKERVWLLTVRRSEAPRARDFYVNIGLVLFLGVIRAIDPDYFFELAVAFQNPGIADRRSKVKGRHDSFINFLMNLFFVLTIGFYLFYVVGGSLGSHHLSRASPGFMLMLLPLGVSVIYIVKYAAIRFSGWAFKVESVTDRYVFNVFLINKVIGLLLLPFVIVLAFAGEAAREPTIFVSMGLVGILFASRYVRSWEVFGSFFQYSKFHFFTYICASELLPLAVLLKLLVRGLSS